MKKMDSEPEPDPEPVYVRDCKGCIEKQENQFAHYGGCMPDIFAGETWEDM